MNARIAVCFLMVAFTPLAQHAEAAELEDSFLSPPASARPHTWWHWMNGHVSREGITKDLEAMERIGLGGFQAFHVTDGIPAGPVGYMTPRWRELMQHTAREADRLGLEMCLHNCAGWSSSGGPWITPENAMFEIVWTEAQVHGGADGCPLQQPTTRLGYYRDIGVLAFPTPLAEAEGGSAFRLKDAPGKAGFKRLDKPKPDDRIAPPEASIPLNTIVDVTKKISTEGNLEWHAPPGEWTVLRFGYTPTGVTNRPAPKEGIGLECDKLSRTGAVQHWNGIVQKVLDDAGPLAPKTLNNVLVDSYETGRQNWTHDFASQFSERHGYDLKTYLPTVTGRVVESVEVSERFLWDFRRTIADLYLEEYFGAFAQLCHDRGLALSIEPYGRGAGNFHDVEVASVADIPMGEFWVNRPDAWHESSVKLAASAAHAHGRTYVGAESFTAGQINAAWVSHPGSLKARGDYFFAKGLNRIIFHTYVHKPWHDSIRPGMTMGPHGMQLNRKTTWFEQARPWIDYLSRCQLLLQQGDFVADIAYLASENAPNILLKRTELSPPPPAGYDYDSLCTRDLMTMRVEDGRVKLPSGMAYRVLVLPAEKRMRPEVLEKIRQLVDGGATVFGTRPTKSPSLASYPNCDDRVQHSAAAIWRGENVFSSDKSSLGEILRKQDLPPDFEVAGLDQDHDVRYLHRRARHADIYFVTNQRSRLDRVNCVFRTVGRQPYLWRPESGEIEPAGIWTETEDGRTQVSLQLGPEESVFVVFVVFAETKSQAPHALAYVPPKRGQTASLSKSESVKIIRAAYGPFNGEDRRRVDVTRQLQQLIDQGNGAVVVGNHLAKDPAPGVMKRLRVSYERNGKPQHRVVEEGGTLHLGTSSPPPVFEPSSRLAVDDGAVHLRTFISGEHEIALSNGNSVRMSTATPSPLEIEGPWALSLQSPDEPLRSIDLPELVSLSEHRDDAVKYFAGTAEYRCRFHVSKEQVGADKIHQLDLGDVQVLARVVLNGHDLGTLWRAPYSVEVTDALVAGPNELVVRVTTTWPNRLIGNDRRAARPAKRRGPSFRSLPMDDLISGKLPDATSTYSTWRHWLASDSLHPAGLIGPVHIYHGIRREAGNPPQRQAKFPE